MNDVFGIPMNTIMIVLIATLGLCLLTVAWVAWRRPVIFKLGMRNIPRRKAQTAVDRGGVDALDAHHDGRVRHRRYDQSVDHVRRLQQPRARR